MEVQVGLAVAVLTGEENAVSIWSTKVEIVFGHRHSTSHATLRVPPGRVKGSHTSLTPHQKRSECDIPFYRTKRRDLVVSETEG